MQSIVMVTDEAESIENIQKVCLIQNWIW